jgi:geranylgeranyl reductase family protein
VGKCANLTVSAVDRGMWDVAVIGAGPAGALAAVAAASAGSRVILLERAVLPRYKTCGGGLVGASMAALPKGMPIPVKQEIMSFTFSLAGHHERTRRAGLPAVRLVRRDEFDAALVRVAADAGVRVCEKALVRRLDQDDDGVRITTLQHGQITARAVVGADGTGGRSAWYVGVRYTQTDLGLELELPALDGQAETWKGRILMDWGRLPGGYGWVFPKGDIFSVGVIGHRQQSEQVRAYLTGFLREHGFSGTIPHVKSGHLTRCRTDDSPLFRGRVLVAGDAAGLLEPWTREGISFALRSGAMAGKAAAEAATGTTPVSVAAAMEGYTAQVMAELVPEIRAGRNLLDAFTRRPSLFHLAVVSLPAAWRVFLDIVGGEATFADVTSHSSARAILSLIRHSPAFRRQPAIRADTAASDGSSTNLPARR